MSSMLRKAGRAKHRKRADRKKEWQRYVEAFVAHHGVEGALLKVWQADSPSAGKRSRHSRWIRWAARRDAERRAGRLRAPVYMHLLLDADKERP